MALTPTLSAVPANPPAPLLPSVLNRAFAGKL